MVVRDLLLLTLNDVPSSVTLAGVEGDENVGLVEEHDVAGACTVICKHLELNWVISIDSFVISIRGKDKLVLLQI